MKIEEMLALIYNKSDTHGRTVIAKLCDETFDRSGALLGRIRELPHKNPPHRNTAGARVMPGDDE